ncbi:hypothetical protein ISCGN_013568 [Ixodes scapularis]
MATTNSGASTSAASAKGNGGQKRLIWTRDTTLTLISLWEDNLASLRGVKRNAAIFARITESLNSAVASAGVQPVELFTAKQVKLKIENLGQIYRKHARALTTGSEPVKWFFFAALHKFLGSLPLNDASLVEESLEKWDPLFLPFDMAAKEAPVPAVAAASLRSPAPFSFDDVSEWLPWMQRFEDYFFATGMHVAPGETRVRTLLYCMGPRARIVLSSLMSDEDGYTGGSQASSCTP